MRHEPVFSLIFQLAPDKREDVFFFSSELWSMEDSAPFSFTRRSKHRDQSLPDTSRFVAAEANDVSPSPSVEQASLSSP